MPPSDCFGTGREHKLNLLCGLFGVLDCKWMSGPAGSRDHQPRGTRAQTGIRSNQLRALLSAPRNLVLFLLTLTYMDGGQPPGTQNSSSDGSTSTSAIMRS